MATTFYLFRDTTGADTDPPGSLTADIDLLASLTRDTVVGTVSNGTVNGPTAGVPMESLITADTVVCWISNPLAAVTISGTVTFNVWMNESNMSANAGAQVTVDRLTGAGAFVSTIVNSEKGTELPVSVSAAQNWTAAPTSTTLSAGDRIRIKVFANDVGTMASTHSVNLEVGAATASITGDSWVQFTETITESGGAPAANPPYRNRHIQLLAH